MPRTSSQTDEQAAAGEHKVLQDTCVFGFGHLALVTTRTSSSGLWARVHVRVINAVNRRLTTSAVIKVARGVGVDTGEALVAERFLT